jgi:predicted dehydrogenase
MDHPRLQRSDPCHVSASLTLDMGNGTIELFDHESDTVEVVQVSFAVEVQELESPGARNVGMIYEKFAKGETEGEHGFVDFGEAVRVHRLLDAMERSSEEKKVISVFG